MKDTGHTIASVKLLEAMLTDEQKAFLAESPGLVGTLEREREYLFHHWVWGWYPEDEREQMALDNYAGRIKAFMRGTLGLRD